MSQLLQPMPQFQAVQPPIMTQSRQVESKSSSAASSSSSLSSSSAAAAAAAPACWKCGIPLDGKANYCRKCGRLQGTHPRRGRGRGTWPRTCRGAQYGAQYRRVNRSEHAPVVTHAPFAGISDIRDLVTADQHFSMEMETAGFSRPVSHTYTQGPALAPGYASSYAIPGYALPYHVSSGYFPPGHAPPGPGYALPNPGYATTGHVPHGYYGYARLDPDYPDYPPPSHASNGYYSTQTPYHVLNVQPSYPSSHAACYAPDYAPHYAPHYSPRYAPDYSPHYAHTFYETQEEFQYFGPQSHDDQNFEPEVSDSSLSDAEQSGSDSESGSSQVSCATSFTHD
jgi:hypothetical protein